MIRKPLLILLLLTLAACGGETKIQNQPPPPYGSTPAPSPSSSPTVSPTRTTSPTSSPTPSPKPKPTTKPPKNKLIKWLQNFTPTGGGGSTWNAAYTNFIQGNCWATLELARTEEGNETLEPLEEPLRSVYEGAAAACLAALHGRADLWRTAEVSADRVEAADLDCWDRSVFQILDTLVRAHRDDARTRFTRSRVRSTGCPELGRTEPRHGPAEGGYTITIHGRNFPPTLNLWWEYDETITAHRTSPTTMELTVPPAEDDEESVNIMVEGAPRIEAAYSGFTYDR